MKTRFSLENVLQEIKTLSYVTDAGNIAMANVLGVELLRNVAEEIADIRNQRIMKIMVHILDPGQESPKHRDWVSPTATLGEWACLERWHLPIQTNEKAIWWDEKEGERHLPLGYWSGPMPYWRYHLVSNKGVEARIHIIVDLDSPKAVGKYEEQIER